MVARHATNGWTPAVYTDVRPAATVPILPCKYNKEPNFCPAA